MLVLGGKKYGYRCLIWVNHTPRVTGRELAANNVLHKDGWQHRERLVIQDPYQRVSKKTNGPSRREKKLIEGGHRGGPGVRCP